MVALINYVLGVTKINLSSKNTFKGIATCGRMHNKIVKGKIRELSRKGRRDQEPKWKIGKGEYHQSKF